MPWSLTKFTKFFLLSMFTLAMLVAHAFGQINPATNIRWPQPACSSSNPSAFYTPGANTCIPISSTGGLPILNPTFLGALTGPTINSSVNTQINVMAPPYNATGNCSTDDHAAILAAMTTAMSYAGANTLPAVLYFPKPPGGCYLTSTLPFYGISMIGEPNGQGAVTGAGSTPIRSMPGQDIFAAPDPSTSVSTFPWYGSWTIRDITFQVDSSVAGNFPHRWPGRWFDDTSTTSGSAVISTVAGYINCDDVGQAIQINGAGAGGTNLVTTIQSVNPCAQSNPAGSGLNGWKVITLAANASATLTNAHTYVSLLGLPVTKTIGNCALAFPEIDAQPSDWPVPTQAYGQGPADMSNVTFASWNGGPSANACGIFSQGHQSPYQFDVKRSNFVQLPFGNVEGTSELHSANASSGNDFQTFDHMWFFGDTYPWITYNGGGNTISNWQLSVNAGPQILQVGATNGDCACGWNIQTGGFETTGTPTGYGVRIEGYGHQLNGVTFSTTGLTGYIGATDAYGIANSGAGGAYVTGSNIRIDLGQGQADPTGWHDLGIGNTIRGTYDGTNATGLQPPYPITMLPYKGETQITGRTTANFIRDGNYATPYNWDDLMFWPQDYVIAPSIFTPVYANLFIQDSTSPTGAVIAFHSTSFLNLFQQFKNHTNRFSMTVGTDLPAAPATWYYMAKCPTGVTSFTFSIKMSNNVVAASDSHSCNTTFQTYSARVDFTTFAGLTAGFIGGNAAPNTVLVAWVALRPDVADINGVKIGPRNWSCQPGYGDGTAAITGTKNLSTCYNDTGFPITLTSIGCFTDNAGTSTMTAANTSGSLLSSSPLTCTTAFAGGTVNGSNKTLLNGDYIRFVFVPDGTSKQTTLHLGGTY